MKTIFKLLSSCIFLLIMPFFAWSQSHPLLQDFSGFQQGDNVFLRWTFRSGSLCEGTRIERSQDGMIFTEIGEIPGICGSPEVAFTYTFTDSTPLTNAVNIYRLELGNTGFTTNLQVEYFVTGDGGYSILSTGSEVELLISDPPSRNGSAQVYSTSGSLLKEFSFNNRRFLLTENISQPGIYIFRLQYDNGSLLSGKFIRP